MTQGALGDAERILRAGGTAPTDFTLHDGDHSFRVAQRMAEIVSAEVLRQVSAYDVAMLLLSAYLHDIGMTPPAAKVQRHHAYLLVGADDVLSDEERDDLQAWLDESADGLVPPIATGAPTTADLRLASRLTAGYVRARHNDWSEQWIRATIEPYAGRLYAGWLDDLVLLCKSHHHGFDRLRGQRFDPRLVGADAEVLHLRYCACVLRVADILDFDPERTPAVVFEHRDVDPASAIFWHKDHHLSFAYEGGRILIQSRPPDAQIHRAVEETIEGVDRELLLCRRLADETHFERFPGLEADLPHRWELETHVRARVEPGDAYEYIDGTFRPEPAKILELIGGLNLYKSELAAVRELLQNAFDAVREQVALERLLEDDPTDPDVVASILDRHKVALNLQPSEDGLVLTCSDTGAGMSKDILTGRFLVGGAPRSSEILELERRCREAGFSVGRTAQFGIGVLSYFLLADRISVQTRRSAEAGDPDGTGWRFDTAGIEAFGELRPDSRRKHGAAVRLELDRKAVERVARRDDGASRTTEQSNAAFAASVAAYIRREVRRPPCRLTFEADGMAPPLDLPRGWGALKSDRILNDLRPFRFGPVVSSPDQPSGRSGAAGRSRTLADVASEALRWSIATGQLPGGLGDYRIAIPYFEIAGHQCLDFVDIEDPTDLELGVSARGLGARDAYSLFGRLGSSWNGIYVNFRADLPTRDAYARGALVDVDWTSDRAGRLAVDRETVDASDAARSALAFVRDQIELQTKALLESFDASPFTLMNHVKLGLPPPTGAQPYWIARRPTSEGLRTRLEPLPTPCVDEDVDFSDVSSLQVVEGPSPRLAWRGRELHVVPKLRWSFGDLPVLRTWHGRHVPPSAVGVQRSAGVTRPLAVWNDAEPRGPSSDDELRPLAKFPPAWSALCAYSPGNTLSGSDVLWNAAHPIAAQVTPEAYQWAFRNHQKLITKWSATEVLESVARCAAWLALLVVREEVQFWGDLVEETPAFTEAVWSKVFGDDPTPVVCWYSNRQRTEEGEQLHVLLPGQCHLLEDPTDSQIAQYLPDPDPEWVVEAVGPRDGVSG
ncbi:MAG TPA: hypothetical protein VHF90_10730 [Thermoleophilaceae bacterium]|nr:hypothetical protein [Thermoleophilaceae bacterium]